MQTIWCKAVGGPKGFSVKEFRGGGIYVKELKGEVGVTLVIPRIV